MDDHCIRLRGGWEWRDSRALGVTSHRVTLPMIWPCGIEGLVHLRRAFQAPPIDPMCQSVLLRLDQVGGLQAVSLNDCTIARTGGDRTALVLPLNELAERRNALTLLVDCTLARKSAPAETPWGSIALVIRSHAEGRPGSDPLGE